MGTSVQKPWKLYVSAGACSLAPHIVLRELGIDFELVVLSIIKGFPDDYRRVNPKLRVPALQFDHDNVLTELPAIMTAISQQVPTSNIMGSTDLETCRVYEWLNWLSGTVHDQAYGGLLRPARFTNDPALHDVLKEKARETIKDCYIQIEQKLQGIHAVGDNFTAVDAFLYPIYRWGNWHVSLPMKESYPKYTALIENMLKMDSVRAALRAEGTDCLFRRAGPVC